MLYRMFFLITVLSFSCSKKEKEPALPDAPDINKKIIGEKSIETTEIIKRNSMENKVWVRMIMISFGKLSPRFSTPEVAIDKKVDRLTEKQAQNKAKALLKRINSGEDFKKLQIEASDDPFSGPDGDYLIVENDGVDTPLKSLSLRLQLKETGVIRGGNEYLIVQRIPPPPQVKSPDTPGIMDRKPDGRAKYRFITIGWRDLRQKYAGYLTKGATGRSQQRAAELVISLKKRLDEGEDFDKLYKQFTERVPQEEKYHSHTPKMGMMPDHNHDHGHDHSKHDHGTNPATPKAKTGNFPMSLAQIQKTAVRLKPGEYAIVSTDWGYHIVNRQPDPTPGTPAPGAAPVPTPGAAPVPTPKATPAPTPKP
ncbi:peptidylprolyl isomerase [Myxococcota bacterium]|nr:peptidylprolyl isomerase [Myxococcota bacterium]MBU1383024.1 peptidylprolyl isomerase [Myxococcota bacterium]MBU1495789.1 peptidylprolyl isomerase [Myxococcota bacterium]